MSRSPPSRRVIETNYISTSTIDTEPSRYSAKRSKTSYYPPRRRSRSRHSDNRRRSNTPNAKLSQSSPNESDRHHQRHSYPSPLRGSATSTPSPPPFIRRGATVAATARKSPIPKRLHSKSPLFSATKPSSSSSRHYNDVRDVARSRRATTHAPMGVGINCNDREYHESTRKDKKKKKRSNGEKKFFIPVSLLRPLVKLLILSWVVITAQRYVNATSLTAMLNETQIISQ